MTLRNSTERPETVTVGTNQLIGFGPIRIGTRFEQFVRGKVAKKGIPDKWDGKTAERIVLILEKLLCQ